MFVKVAIFVPAYNYPKNKGRVRRKPWKILPPVPGFFFPPTEAYPPALNPLRRSLSGRQSVKAIRERRQHLGEVSGVDTRTRAVDNLTWWIWMTVPYDQRAGPLGWILCARCGSRMVPPIQNGLAHILHPPNTTNTTEHVMIEINIPCKECHQCGLIYFAIEQLHLECPVCCFPLGELLPEEVFADLWTRRPEG